MGRVRSEIESRKITPLVLRVIRRHRGKPCPSRAEFIAWTGLPRREVWPFVKSLAQRDPPLIEIEERLHARAGMRRLRLTGDEWTGWTQRKTPSRDDCAVRQRRARKLRHARKASIPLAGIMKSGESEATRTAAATAPAARPVPSRGGKTGGIACEPGEAAVRSI